VDILKQGNKPILVIVSEEVTTLTLGSNCLGYHVTHIRCSPSIISQKHTLSKRYQRPEQGAPHIWGDSLLHG